MADSKTTSAMIAVLAAAILWGFIGYFTRNLSDYGFTAMQVSFVRMSVGTGALVIGLAIFDRDSFKVHRRDFWIFFFFGIFKILSDYFLFEAQIRIHLSLSTVLQLTSPYWVLLLSIFLFNEKLTARKVFSICLAFFGCILVTGVLSKNIDYDTAGIAFAIASGISYAVYTVGTKVLLDRGYTTNTVLLYIFVISMLISIPFSDVPAMVGRIENLDVVWNMLAMGILMTLIPYYLNVYAVRYISPVRAQVIGALEVASAVFAGWLIYDESLGWLNIIGMVLIPVSIILMNLGTWRRPVKVAN